MRDIIRSALRAILLSLCAFATARIRHEGVSPPFAPISFEEAVSQAGVSNRILVVKATASWCAPCKRMDQTTWPDARVLAWFSEHGIAIRFNVDQQRELAAMLKIEAMPTVLAFVNGEEAGRLVGYRGTGELVAWLDAIRIGKRLGYAFHDRTGPPSPALQKEFVLRRELAGSLVRQGTLDQAAEEYVWLWRHARQMEEGGNLYQPALGRDMAALAGRHAPARDRFRLLRNELGEVVSLGAADAKVLEEWIVLNGVVGEAAATLAWFDKVVGDPDWTERISLVGFLLTDDLERAHRWADIARVYPDLLEEIRREHKSLVRAEQWISNPGTSADHGQIRGVHVELFQESVGRLYAAALAAGHDDDASRIVLEGLRLDDSATMRIALVSWALQASQSRMYHIELLDEAAARGGTVSVRALQKKLARDLQRERANPRGGDSRR